MRFHNALFIVAVLSLLIVAASFLFSNSENPERTGTGVKYEVSITSKGFLPRDIKVKTGDTIVFVNKDAAPHRPASDLHPTHNVYPEKGGCIGSKFDACRELKTGETFEFTFFEKGSWCYHDHNNPGFTGCVDLQ